MNTFKAIWLKEDWLKIYFVNYFQFVQFASRRWSELDFVVFPQAQKDFILVTRKYYANLYGDGLKIVETVKPKSVTKKLLMEDILREGVKDNLIDENTSLLKKKLPAAKRAKKGLSVKSVRRKR